MGTNLMQPSGRLLDRLSYTTSNSPCSMTPAAPLANIRYRIGTDTGQIFTGTTDTAGQTHRIAADASATLKIYTTEH